MVFLLAVFPDTYQYGVSSCRISRHLSVWCFFLPYFQTPISMVFLLRISRHLSAWCFFFVFPDTYLHGVSSCSISRHLSVWCFFLLYFQTPISMVFLLAVFPDTYDAVVTAGGASPGHFPLDTFDDLIRIIKPGNVHSILLPQRLTFS